jgi:two-component system chemotaxis sensor kinase CheA
MKNADVLNLVDQISQSLVFGEPDQAETLQNLPEAFGELGAMVREMGRDEEAEVCLMATSISVKILDGSVDWKQGLRILSETVNALQACLGDECPASEAGFPAELAEGLPETEPAPVEAPAACPSTPAAESSDNDSLALVDDAILGEFLTRQLDILQDVEKHLMNVEGGHGGDDTWLLRFYHTLKGESGLLGMNDVSEICHATEDMIQKSSVTACVEALLDVNDWFTAKIRHITDGSAAPASLSEMLGRLKDFNPGETGSEAVQDEPAEAAAEPETEGQAPEVAAEETPTPKAVEVSAVAYEVVEYAGKNILEGDVDLLQDFVEEAVEHLDASEAHLLTIESDPKETEALNAVFRGFHTIKGLAGFIELDHVKDLAHKAENLLDMARRDELDLVGANMDAVFESVDMMKRLVTDVTEAMGGSGVLQEEKNLARLMGKLVALTSGEAQPAEAEPAAAAPACEPVPQPEPEVAEAKSAPAPAKASGFIPLGNMKKKAPAPVAAAPKPAPAPEAAKPAASGSGDDDDAPAAKKTAQAPVKVKEAVRVDSERLDRLIETIGELVIAESMVTQSTEIKNTQMSVKMSKDIDHLDKICRELQEIGMSLRMVPVRPVFQKMARLVRDLSKKTNRKVDFVMSGEDTELDKNVVDKIGDPLVHMVRNSVDHGIEPDSDDRLKTGKPERGRIELRAFHKGGNICIEIEDDGRGLDKNAILQKAISRGLIREGENLTDREIFNMIFEAGFSTAKQVTEVSGRGVGMDVVRRNIEELRGTVEISSEVGKGSTFSIKLPLTLAIIEGMVIMVGQEHYIIPTLSVVRLIRPHPEDITHVFDKGEMLAFEGEHLPLFRLSGLFDVEEAKTCPHEGTVVVVEDEGRKIGLMADELLGQQSIVIKSLGESVQGTDGVAGGAIMSDGNVALILDIAGIVRVAHAVDTTRHSNRGTGKAAASLDQGIVGGLTNQPVAEAVEADTVEEVTGIEADPVPTTVGV